MRRKKSECEREGESAREVFRLRNTEKRTVS